MTTIDSDATLEACLEASGHRPVYLFKHSTRCPISSGALGEVRAYIDESGDAGLPVYILYVVESRFISNKVAEHLGVRHESPQLLLISSGKAVWNTSHGSITRATMQSAAEKHARMTE